ncbi:translation initiation factor IF-3, C-terminal domain-containing protein [Circinella umbellata]|nr:translation initiation factor IF-3, C-terminal domain-containing protein [Circinella umbellata]
MYRHLARTFNTCTRLNNVLSRQQLEQPHILRNVIAYNNNTFMTRSILIRSLMNTTHVSQAPTSNKGMSRPRRDEEITSRFITFIDDKGQVLEQRARLDDVLHSFDRSQYFLMEVQPGKTPVCRLFDKKAMFEKQKQKKKTKQTNPEAVVKEIVFGWNVSEHDMEHKLGRAKQFLEKGNKVKIEITTKKGQQRLDKQEKAQVVERVAEHLSDYKNTKKAAFVQGGNCVLQYEKK